MEGQSRWVALATRSYRDRMRNPVGSRVGIPEVDVGDGQQAVG